MNSKHYFKAPLKSPLKKYCLGMSCLPSRSKVSNKIAEFNAVRDEPDDIVKFFCMFKLFTSLV